MNSIDQQNALGNNENQTKAKNGNFLRLSKCDRNLV